MIVTARAAADARPRAGSASPRLAIVGGGITGLAAAQRVVERWAGRIDVVLLEAGERLGGVIATERTGGFLIEGGPDSFVTEKPQAVALCRRLGLEDDLLPTNEGSRRTLVVRDGRLVPLPEAFQLLAPARLMPFLRSPILSWRGKLATLRDLVKPRGGPPLGGDESLASFVRRRFGEEVLERIAQPMVGGIYTADPETLSLTATMPRFLEIERRSRSVILALRRSAGASRGTSGARFGLFVTLREGLASLVDALVRRLPAGAVRTRARVVALERCSSDDAGGQPAAHPAWVLALADGSALEADAVLIALPAPRAAELLARVDPKLAAELEGISCASSVTVSLGYRRADVGRPLDAFGIVVPEIERRKIVGCSFASVKYPGRAPEGHVLLRAFVGGAMHPELAALDDAALLAAVREELRALLGIAAEPALVRIHRWPESMPQYRVGHLHRVARIRERLAGLPGLALAGNAFDGVGASDCIRTAEGAVDALVDALAVAVRDDTGRAP